MLPLSQGRFQAAGSRVCSGGEGRKGQGVFKELTCGGTANEVMSRGPGMLWAGFDGGKPPCCDSCPSETPNCVFKKAQAGAASFASVLARCPWLGAGITHPVVRAGQESPQSLGKEC